MRTPDDKVLVRFLITSFCKSIEGTLQPVPKSGLKNLRGFKHSEEDITYLETAATGELREQTDVRVMLGREGGRVQIWGMHVVARLNAEEIRRAGLSVDDIRPFLLRARRNGFDISLSRLETGELFSLFAELSYEEVLLVKHGKSGTIRYSHDIESRLDDFCGDEEILFRPEGKPPIKVFTSHVQGGRL